MWIQTENTDSDGNPVTRSLKPPFCDDPVEFTTNGKAQVPAEIGERLVAEFDSLRPVDTDTDTDSDSDSDSDAESGADSADSDGDADAE